MAEEQPSAIHEGAAAPHAPSSTPEDRKAAAALSTLDTQDDGSAGKKKDVDSKALDAATKDLSIKDDKPVKKAVKVEAKDVAFLVAELELSKQKSTELLKEHEGSLVKAMTAYVSAPA